MAKFETEIDTALRNHGNPEFFNMSDPSYLLEGEDGARYDSLMDRIPKGGVARFFSEYCDLLGPLADSLNSVNVPDDPQGPLAGVDVDSLQRELNAVVVRYPDIALPQVLDNCLRSEDGESSLQEDLAQSREIMEDMDVDNQEALDWASAVMDAGLATFVRNTCSGYGHVPRRGLPRCRKVSLVSVCGLCSARGSDTGIVEVRDPLL